MKKIDFNCDNFNGVQTSLLLETATTKEIRICMQKSTSIKEHNAPYDITLQVLKGSIDFGVNGKNTTLNEFDLIFLDANTPHNLLSNEDSIIRLSLSKNDSMDRINSVL